MIVRFKFRRGPATEWTSDNPVLSAGEPGLETDTGKFKIGDGVKSWNALSYHLNAADTFLLIQTALEDAVLEGVKGDPGDSAYEVAVTNGFVGTEAAWLTSLKGATGDTGPAGSAGPKGDKGDTGETGSTGPKGDKGDQGDAGPIGFTGATGDTGPKGDKGDQGDPGPPGDTGPQGIQGDPGPPGDAGPKGDKGDKGDTGDQGPIGLTGTTGSTGSTGPQGDSAYQVAVANGFVGTQSQWLASLVGPTGPAGTPNSARVVIVTVGTALPTGSDLTALEGALWVEYTP